MGSDPQPVTLPGLLEEDDDEETLTRSWAARGIDLLTLSQDPSGTLTPVGWTQVAALQAQNLVKDDIDELTKSSVLGRGGTGVVWLASQPALAREVAIKELNEEADEKASSWLLREARVTGALEHPNIVPVHALSRGSDGRPMIVMKRVEGHTWADALEKDHAALSFGDYLDKHLRILVQVARAVGYAHQRRVLHRDIKTENVMLGSFGEVYLVDWDIAAALEGCTIGGLPEAAKVDDLFGTPGYMAPEMVGCTGRDFGPPTDVYLLGANLHVILTGGPPHHDVDLTASLTKAYVSAPPQFDARVPGDLADICRRALRRLPSERYPTAAAFADDVELFLRHRHSLALSDEGKRRLDRLEAVLGEEEASTPQAAEAASVYRECRFLFEQALQIWPGNEVASSSLEAAAERMVRRELLAARPEAARALLDDLRAPPPALVALVEEALAARKKSDQRLLGLAHDRDIEVGVRSRGVGAALLSVGSVALNLVCGALARAGVEIAHVEYAGAQALNLVWAVVIVVLLRRQVWGTTANKQVTFTSVLTIASYVVIHLLAKAVDVPFHAALVLQCFVLGLLWVLATAVFDRRMAALPVVAFGAIPLLVVLPAWSFEILAAAVGLGLVLTAAILVRSAKAAAPGSGSG